MNEGKLLYSELTERVYFAKCKPLRNAEPGAVEVTGKQTDVTNGFISALLKWTPPNSSRVIKVNGKAKYEIIVKEIDKGEL